MSLRTAVVRLAAATAAVALALGSATVLAFALTAPARAQEPPVVHGRVINFACDRMAGVTALQIVVEGDKLPAVLTLSWDNRKACGTPA